MKTDAELKRDVMDELSWEPGVNAEAVGVAVKDGVVTLSGSVDNYMAKIRAERAVERVMGVKALAQEIKVKLPGDFERTDEDIASAAANALEWNMSVPDDRVKVKVQNGRVTLTGEVDWRYQRDAAEDSVCCLMGVTGVTNLITLKKMVEAPDIKAKITAAFQRNAMLDAKSITAKTVGDKAILEGAVHSFAEKREAERAAYAAPGVCRVENNLLVTF
jgi:osmotically-inducible protein OsmY